jgi:hypothetical protein
MITNSLILKKCTKIMVPLLHSLKSINNLKRKFMILLFNDPVPTVHVNYNTDYSYFKGYWLIIYKKIKSKEFFSSILKFCPIFNNI